MKNIFKQFIHAYNFCLGKGKLKNCYKGFAIRVNFYFFVIKFERIGFGKYFNTKLEITNWRE